MLGASPSWYSKTHERTENPNAVVKIRLSLTLIDMREARYPEGSMVKASPPRTMARCLSWRSVIGEQNKADVNSVLVAGLVDITDKTGIRPWKQPL